MLERAYWRVAELWLQGIKVEGHVWLPREGALSEKQRVEAAVEDVERAVCLGWGPGLGSGSASWCWFGGQRWYLGQRLTVGEAALAVGHHVDEARPRLYTGGIREVYGRYTEDIREI